MLDRPGRPGWMASKQGLALLLACRQRGAAALKEVAENKAELGEG